MEKTRLFPSPTHLKTAWVAVTIITDKASVTQSTTGGILIIFVEFLQRKYEPTQVDDARVTRMEKAGRKTLPLGWRDFLYTPSLKRN